MFSQTMVAAIDAARTLTQLDHLSTDIWKAWGAGQIGDEAQLLAMQLEARRKALRGDLKPVGIPPGRPSIFPPRRPQRAPVRAVAIARRRHLAASGPMPPALGGQVHGRRAGRAADRRRRGPRRRAVRPLHRRDRGQGRGVPAVGSERHPAGGPPRAAHDPGAAARGPEEPPQHRPGDQPGMARVAAARSAPHGCESGERGHSARHAYRVQKYSPHG